mmetsp:Transcript_21904/g.46048  ORF Transcript_21904/g.46048 Transcript_21904/m.46048 type:complete len:292 (-) Transcript_21904:158-1033(-)|eukprot:CAMPEP_0171347884 /NCGR_PEP_ID=MMETSP0878-20121228/29354_1 /TAXON_ID=67004 /ORGANISM="Thalassiosira weissflogii, Strain CCMP1336" /LENGTH=291 /DNA_ID=CAMNT_0011852071 /DNA_START=202 /DNA_END=1077 /DNA_ORIENTATION=+
MVVVEEDAAIDTPIRYASKCPSLCCGCRCNYRVPTLQELFDRDKRLLRSILLVVVLLNIPIGSYILYPFMIFSTWIHELFHGLAALSIGGKIIWLNVYSNGSGLAHTSYPAGAFQKAWVAGAGYQGTAIVGGIMLMFRRTEMGARAGTLILGLEMLFTCLLFVRNIFGLVMLILMGIGLVIAGWRLPPFWVSELYALIAATTCLNAMTSIHVLFFVNEQTIGGVTQISDATSMQEATNIPHKFWACLWMFLAIWMTAMGVCIVLETKEGVSSSSDVNADLQEDRPLATEMT